MPAIHWNAEEFKTKIIQDKTDALVDFWASWCGPCKMLAPVVDAIAEELEGKVTVAKIDIDRYPDLAAEYGVMSIPTVVAFSGGAETGRSVGVVPKENLLHLVNG